MKKNKSIAVLGEILTGSQCIKKGCNNDSMGQTIDENFYYARLFVGSCGLYKVEAIDKDKELLADLNHLRTLIKPTPNEKAER